MTVLHVAAGNTYGGIERMLVTLAETRHPTLTQQFAVSFAGRLEQELQAAGVAVHRLPSPRASRPLMIWRARRAFAALQQTLAPAAVIFHSAWPHAMFAAAARAGGARIGFWQHQPIATPAWPDRWARLVRPDFTVFNSSFTQQHPAFPGVPGRVIHCPVPVPPPIAVADRVRLRAQLGARAGDVVALMAARFEEWKGHDVLVRAAQSLPAGSTVRVWIAGGARSAAELSYCKRVGGLVATAGVAARVALLGERDDVPTLMRLADVYCQPNVRGEPFGIAIAEAMRAGLPCVVSATGGTAELLDDASGILTAPGDAAGVAAALVRLETDAQLRAAMGSAAAARAAALTDPAGRLEELVDAMALHAT